MKYARFLVASIALVVCALGSSLSAFAHGDLDIRQAQLAKRRSHLDEVVNWHGDIRYIRDNYYEGPQGVITLAQAWFEEAKEWINLSHELLAMVGQSWSDGSIQEDVTASIQAKAYDRLKGWARLKDGAYALRRRGQRGLDLLGERPPLPNGYVDRYAEALEFFSQRYNDTLIALGSVVKEFDDDSLASWEETLAPTVHAITALLTISRTSVPELKQALEWVAEAVTLDNEVALPAERVNEAYANVRAHLLAHRIFQAVNSLDGMRDLADVAIATISAVQGDPSLKNAYAQRVKQLLGAAEKAVERASNVIPRYVHVARNLQLQVPQLARDCRDNASRPLRDCGALRGLVGLEARHLEEMNDDELRFIEKTLKKIKDGPL